MAFYNLVQVTTNTAGTGTITLGAAVEGFKSFSGVTEGSTVSYGLLDWSNNHRETGRGIYSSGTLTRGPLTSSNVDNSAISLSGDNAIVYLTPNKFDFMNFGGGSFATSRLYA